VRRKVGLVLIGLGAFFIALAPLIRFYVAHQVVAAPLDVYEKTTLRADGATYLDTAKMKVQKGVTVTATNTTRGDVHAGDGKVAVWDSFTSIEDTNAKTKIETQVQRAVFDRRTAELRNGRGAQVNNDANVRQSGLGLFWPIGLKRKSYPYFDTTTKRTWPMNYAGEDRTQGIRTYRFTQTVPPTVTDTIKPGVPASLLGLTKAQLAQVPGYDKKNDAVAVNRVYQAATTAWVDPRTGAQVNLEQKVTTTLRTSDGVDRLVVGDLDLKMTPDSVKHLVDRSDGDAGLVSLVQTYVPYGGGAAGIVLLVLGLALAVSGRRRPAHRGAGPNGSGSAGSTAEAETTRPSDEGPSKAPPPSDH
jgi:hypothetical protein